MIDVDISPSSIRFVEGSVGNKQLKIKAKILLKNTSPKLFQENIGNQNSLFSAYLGTVSESNVVNIWRDEFDSTNIVIPGNSEKEFTYLFTKDLPDNHKEGVYNLIVYIDQHRLLPSIDSSKRNIIKSVYLNGVN